MTEPAPIPRPSETEETESQPEPEIVSEKLLPVEREHRAIKRMRCLSS